MSLFSDSHKRECPRLFQRLLDNGKFSKNAHIGIHNIAKISYRIAIFLGISENEAKMYTGHSVRRSGATMLAASGLSISLLMIAGHWKSEKTARKYIDRSVFTLSKIADAMSSCFDSSTTSETDQLTSSSTVPFSSHDDNNDEVTQKKVCRRTDTDPITQFEKALNNNSNCNFNFYFNTSGK